jgi:hypothetical protein
VVYSPRRRRKIAMTDDIVKELREAAKPDFLAKGSVWGQQEVRIALLSEAADQIERLRARLERVEDNEFYSYLDVVERSDD